MQAPTLASSPLAQTVAAILIAAISIALGAVGAPMLADPATPAVECPPVPACATAPVVPPGSPVTPVPGGSKMETTAAPVATP